VIGRNRVLAAVRMSALAVTAFALASCVTPPSYGPIGHVKNQYGYRDSENADGSHTILVVAASAPMAHEFWDRRAAEICAGAEVQKNIFRAQRPVVTTTGYASNGMGGGGTYQQDTYGDFFLEGYLRCGVATAAVSDEAPGERAAAAETPATP
jgi:hypothetical protein